ncbi:hypothetical protein [Pseudomonas sp. WHRI 8519]|uniref:hypothetical protein n=1 Tax=Pseudomonas sp. WHRI 8519 TaxID=3162567 RepID=UPI0032ECD8F9
MSSHCSLSTAVVLSPGVWQQLMEPGPGDVSADQVAQRLAILLTSALAAATHSSPCPTDLHIQLPQDGVPSAAEQLSLLRLAHITPRSAPSFLHIRLPAEHSVDLTIL